MRMLLLISVVFWAIFSGRCVAYLVETASTTPSRLSVGDGKERLLERLIIRAKRLRPAGGDPVIITRFSGLWTKQQILECIFSIFVPPVALFIHGGHDMVVHFVVNSILWILGFAVGPVVLGWLPGPIHAFWFCFFRNGVF